MKKTLLVLALTVGLLLPAAAFADTAAWEFSTPGNSFNNTVGYSLGDVFVATSNMYVTFLGYYAPAGAAGLIENHGVSLYNANGGLLASTVINSTAGYFTAHFVYNPVTPVELFAGQTYVIDGASGFIDPYAFNDPGFTVYAPINLLGDNWIGGNGDYFTGTNVIGDVSDGFWGPNFGWTTSAPTPEPGTLMMLGTGVVGLAGMLRRKLF